ncbi:MAG: hypothetical protein U5R48_08095 [Gammaproteobacteria bacterium]|nr:hypothetical protein [Gammaproteobacteria bacterium]
MKYVRGRHRRRQLLRRHVTVCGFEYRHDLDAPLGHGTCMPVRCSSWNSPGASTTSTGVSVGHSPWRQRLGQPRLQLRGLPGR